MRGVVVASELADMRDVPVGKAHAVRARTSLATPWREATLVHPAESAWWLMFSGETSPPTSVDNDTLLGSVGELVTLTSERADAAAAAREQQRQQRAADASARLRTEAEAAGIFRQKEEALCVSLGLTPNRSPTRRPSASESMSCTSGIGLCV